MERDDKASVTVYLPRDLHRQAKSRAALDGRSLSELVEQALRTALAESRERRRRS